MAQWYLDSFGQQNSDILQLIGDNFSGYLHMNGMLFADKFTRIDNKPNSPMCVCVYLVNKGTNKGRSAANKLINQSIRVTLTSKGVHLTG